MRKTKNIIGFLAAMLNIAASFLYWHAGGRQGIDQTAADTSTGIANVLFIMSFIFWAVFLAIAFSKKNDSRSH